MHRCSCRLTSCASLICSLQSVNYLSFLMEIPPCVSLYCTSNAVDESFLLLIACNQRSIAFTSMSTRNTSMHTAKLLALGNIPPPAVCNCWDAYLVRFCSKVASPTVVIIQNKLLWVPFEAAETSREPSHMELLCRIPCHTHTCDSFPYLCTCTVQHLFLLKTAVLYPVY